MNSNYNHWRLEQDNNGLARLHFDHQGSSVNLLSTSALAELDDILGGFDDTTTGLIIQSDKASGFIAGADVRGFQGMDSMEDMQQHIRKVHTILQRLEDLPFPTLALIHGFCLGGGLELALACDYRVANDEPSTRIGFPEVRLGIFPGYGGTARALQKLSPVDAMTLMMSGSPVNARKAKRIGLIDAVAPVRQLENAAIGILECSPSPSRGEGWGGGVAHLLNYRPLRTIFSNYLKKQTAKKVREDHYPAPFALINHWKHHGDNKQALLEGEVIRVPELMRGVTSQNLIRAFFLQERLKGLGSGCNFHAEHLHVIGGGVMGGDIAAWGALKGLKVTLQDQNSDALGRTVARAHKLFKRKLRDKLLVRAAMDRLIPDPQGFGIGKADLVIEAVFENLEVKQQIFRELEAKAKPNALLATNTSSIPLEDISRVMHQPQRLIGIHFFNPVAKMQLVEIVHHRETPEQLITSAAAWCKQIGKLPLPVKSRPGFLVNRILMPYLLEAVDLMEEGMPAETIDQAAVDFGMPMGPVELADKVGLDICLAVGEELSEHYPFRVPATLKTVVTEGRLGMKSGHGFYRYSNGHAVKQVQAGKPPSDLADRLVFRLLNEAVACLREEIVADADLLDAGIIFGTGFAPFRGGPMHYINSGGLQRMRERLTELEHQHGEQFHPDDGWQGDRLLSR